MYGLFGFKHHHWWNMWCYLSLYDSVHQELFLLMFLKHVQQFKAGFCPQSSVFFDPRFILIIFPAESWPSLSGWDGDQNPVYSHSLNWIYLRVLFLIITGLFHVRFLLVWISVYNHDQKYDWEWEKCCLVNVVP